MKKTLIIALLSLVLVFRVAAEEDVLITGDEYESESQTIVVGEGDNTVEGNTVRSKSNTGFRVQAQERQEELKELFEQRREELKTRMEALREQFKQKREEFKEKLKTIKDKRKQVTVEAVNTRLATINKNRTDHWNKVLERLNEILGKIQTKADEQEAAGKDTAAVDAAITAASDAIATAQTAVSNQAGKDYTITITTEDELKDAATAAFKQLKADLGATRVIVGAAHSAVKTAAGELRKLFGVEKPDEATEEAQ